MTGSKLYLKDPLNIILCKSRMFTQNKTLPKYRVFNIKHGQEEAILIKQLQNNVGYVHMHGIEADVLTIKTVEGMSIFGVTLHVI